MSLLELNLQGFYQHLRKTVHKVGHPISARVIGYKHPPKNDSFPYGGSILLEANSEYNVELPFLFMVDDYYTKLNLIS